jgi:hypothetical protein
MPAIVTQTNEARKHFLLAVKCSKNRHTMLPINRDNVIINNCGNEKPSVLKCSEDDNGFKKA